MVTSSSNNQDVNNNNISNSFKVSKRHQKIIEVLSGSGAGIVTSLMTTPLDVLKTNLQVQTSNKTVLSTTRSLLQTGGISALYTGLQPTLIGSVTTWSIYFTTYSYLKTNISQTLNIDIDSPTLQMASAMLAGANTSFLTAPIWIIKTRLITQEMDGRQKRYKGMTHAFISIIREEGFYGLYKGLGPSLLGTLHVGVQFPLYERLKLIMEKHRDNSQLTLVDIVMASSLSKIVASIVAYPHEVLRSRMQDSSPYSPHPYKGGLGSTLKRIVAEEGVMALYKGMGINLLRVTPACAITFTTYEYIKKYLSNKI